MEVTLGGGCKGRTWSGRGLDEVTVLGVVGGYGKGFPEDTGLLHREMTWSDLGFQRCLLHHLQGEGWDQGIALICGCRAFSIWQRCSVSGSTSGGLLLLWCLQDGRPKLVHIG